MYKPSNTYFLCKFTKFGKCTQFPIITYNTDYLVTGIKDNTQYQYCSIVRQYDDLCGKEGKLYEGKLVIFYIFLKNL